MDSGSPAYRWTCGYRAGLIGRGGPAGPTTDASFSDHFAFALVSLVAFTTAPGPIRSSHCLSSSQPSRADRAKSRQVTLSEAPQHIPNLPRTCRLAGHFWAFSSGGRCAPQPLCLAGTSEGNSAPLPIPRARPYSRIQTPSPTRACQPCSPTPAPASLFGPRCCRGKVISDGVGRVVLGFLDGVGRAPLAHAHAPRATTAVSVSIRRCFHLKPSSPFRSCLSFATLPRLEPLAGSHRRSILTLYDFRTRERSLTLTEAEHIHTDHAHRADSPLQLS